MLGAGGDNTRPFSLMDTESGTEFLGSRFVVSHWAAQDSNL